MRSACLQYNGRCAMVAPVDPLRRSPKLPLSVHVRCLASLLAVVDAVDRPEGLEGDARRGMFRSCARRSRPCFVVARACRRCTWTPCGGAGSPGGS